MAAMHPAAYDAALAEDEERNMRSMWMRLAGACLLAVSLALAACGSKEPEQRAAFIQFLQTRVLDRPGVRVPKPTDEQKKPFGDYAQHYAVIADFNEAMNKSVSQPMDAVIAKGSPRSIGDIVARRDDIRTARDGVKQMRTALDDNLARADAAHAALKQPDDLKAVFDKAYEKTVTLPATTFREVFPALDAVLGGAVRIGDYIEAHRAQIQLSGNAITVNDAKVQNELNAMLQELNGHASAIAAAQRKLRTVVTGS